MGHRNYPKAQHYVPQFYLRHFGIPPKHNRIYAHDLLRNGETYQVAIPDAAQSNQFYSRTGDSKLEHELAELEGAAAAVWKIVSDRQSLSELTEDQKRTMAKFIVTLMVRTPSTRTSITEMAQLTRAWLGNLATPIGADLMNQLNPSEDEAARASVDLVRTSFTWAHLLLQLRWTLLLHPPGISIPTSGCPVAKANEAFARDIGRGHLGLTSPGIQLYVPISSKLVLLIDDAPYYERLPVGVPVILSPENLVYLTHLLVRSATRCLYSEDGRIERRSGMQVSPHWQVATSNGWKSVADYHLE